MAAVAHSESCVCLLIKANAKIDYILSGNLTLLHICSEDGMSKAVDLIIQTEVGKVLNTLETEDGNLPIHLAAMSGNRHIVELLLPYNLERFKNVNIDDIMNDGENRLALWQTKHSEKEKEVSTVDSSKCPRQLESSEPAKSDEDIRLAEEHKQLGNSLYSSKEYLKAIEEYSKAIKLQGNNKTLWSNRSACYLALNKHQDALLDAEICRKLDPTWVKGKILQYFKCSHEFLIYSLF